MLVTGVLRRLTRIYTVCSWIPDSIFSINKIHVYLIRFSETGLLFKSCEVLPIASVIALEHSLILQTRKFKEKVFRHYLMSDRTINQFVTRWHSCVWCQQNPYAILISITISSWYDRLVNILYVRSDQTTVDITTTGPSSSKLTMSLVTVSIKLCSLNMAYTPIFLLKKNVSSFCKSHFSAKIPVN